MTQRSKEVERSDRGLPEGWLFFAVESLVIIAGYVTALRGDLRLREPSRLALLTALVIAHLILLWISAGLLQKRPRLLAAYLRCRWCWPLPSAC